ncbi:MAG: nucleotidyltransferase family protein [Bacteroidetes bacterium]|nr:nucleotidyltransferase family protein [Bacteroidota bacterium]
MSSVELKNNILNSLKQYNPLFIGLFGSFARNEQTDNSDIDILVSFRNPVSLLSLIRIENELSLRLGRKVDLITEGAIKNKCIKKNISDDIQIIFQA